MSPFLAKLFGDNKAKGLKGAVHPTSWDHSGLRASFGLTYNNGKWRYHGANLVQDEIRTPKALGEELRFRRSLPTATFNEICIMPGRPVSVILNSTTPFRLVAGFDAVGSIADLSASLLLEVGENTGGNVVIVGDTGLVVLMLRA